MLEARLQKLHQQMAVNSLDVVALLPGPNLRYLTGLQFHLSERPVVAFFPIEGHPAMVLPQLEANKAQSGALAFQLHIYDDSTGPAGAFKAAHEALGLAGKWLGVEGRRCRYLELELLRQTRPGPEISNADATLAGMRMAKDELELAAMRKAVAIAQEALEATLPCIKPGVTEKEVAAELTLQLLRAGSEPELPFFPLVASGPNSADPHLFPTDRKPQPGDMVVLDWGACHQGYFSDITRCVALGGAPVDPQLVQAHAVTLAANEAGRAAARPGATGQEVDRATRQVIAEAGLGDYFIHRTGHGLGLEGHEEPDMNEGSLIPLEPGMTFTVEPGIYLPGIGGVRIEDDLVITAEGAESLTTLPRELLTLP